MATVIINDTTPRVKYTANGSTTRFDFDFVCFQTADLVVYVGDTVVETGFTITHDPTTLKGYVTFDTAPAAGTGITLVRRMAYDQKVDFTQVANLKRDPLHNEFSRVFAMIQQINEAIGRSVTVDVYSDATPAELTGMIEDLWAIKDDMTTDAANISAITTTARSIANVNAVAANATNINAVAGDLTNIDAAVANATNINTAATNISDINTTAANIAAIIDAPNQASAAAASASLAEDWATKTDGPVEGSEYSAKWYAINTDASGKADKDLSNLTATGLTKIFKTGMMIPWGGTSSNKPDGWLVCDGSAVSRETYADLFAIIGTAYGSGDGTTTFNLPDFTGKWAGGNGNGYLSAGLPNITGNTSSVSNYGGTASGAFYNSTSTANVPFSQGSVSVLNFKASNSNSIYGSASTVQPPTCKSYWLIKY